MVDNKRNIYTNNEQKSSSSDIINASALAATKWESSGMSMQQNEKTSY